MKGILQEQQHESFLERFVASEYLFGSISLWLFDIDPSVNSSSGIISSYSFEKRDNLTIM